MVNSYFSSMVDDAKKRIQLLITNTDCIAWQDFSDKGSPCYNPLVFLNETEKCEDALWLAAVKVAMPHGSYEHGLLMPKVAAILNTKWVTYDWLIKACGRIFNGCDYNEFKNMITLSRTVRDGMEKEGVSN